ncbi:MAG TPA: TA system VapC family ribonuclease toxin [Terriglobia bacterium]|nr:TA system VapC family ribonuclease toxin [Terriglobia bacterium]
MPDINVWVALASDRHVHHRAAGDWFAAIGEAGAAFCRVTQVGFLRLLTNSRVMGDDVLSQRRAWGVYEQLDGDPRVVFAWNRRSLNRRGRNSPKALFRTPAAGPMRTSRLWRCYTTSRWSRSTRDSAKSPAWIPRFSERGPLFRL